MNPMQEEPLVSIIMAAYNAENTIKHAVDSVLSQSFKNWELLIIDDGSSDHTRDIVSCYKDPRIIIIENSENLGVSRTRKVGADIARGEWIAVLDSDDMWRSDKLEKQIELAKNTNGKLFFTASAFMDDAGNQINYILHVPAVLTYRQLLKQNLISNSSVLVNKELYRNYYAIGDKMRLCQEFFAHLRRASKCEDNALDILRFPEPGKSI